MGKEKGGGKEETRRNHADPATVRETYIPCGFPARTVPAWSEPKVQARPGIQPHRRCGVKVRNHSSGAVAQFKTARRVSLAARRLASRTSTLSMWWDSQRYPRPAYFTPKALERATGQPMRRTAAALRWLGWRRIVRRVWGTQRTLWIPPASPLKPRPRGRPRLYPCD